MVCYGPNSKLAERFLTSLYRHTDPRVFTLRAGLNEVAPETASLFAQYSRRFGNIETFEESRNIFKNPLMRRMFTERPITTEWVIWFDDDTHLTRGDWLQRLILQIECSPDIAQWGKTYELYKGDAEVGPFIRTAAWYKGLPLAVKEETPEAQTVTFRFATGGFWALKTDVIRTLDWPDQRLLLANEDFLLGEALRQNGYRIGTFHHGVAVNDHPRRNAEAPEVERLPDR